MNSEEKRNNVKKDYDLIAKYVADDFGTYIEDLDVYEEFEKLLPDGAIILDLGAGPGRTYAYFSQKGYNYIGIDFSSKMQEEAFKIHGEFPYILDDIVNIKNHFNNKSVDAVFSIYTLFHLPPENLEQLIADISDILKDNGVFLLSFQIGSGEELADEPYLGENGKNVLYMSYQNDNEMDKLLNKYNLVKVFQKEKVETLDVAINSNNNITVYKIVKKVN